MRWYSHNSAQSDSTLPPNMLVMDSASTTQTCFPLPPLIVVNVSCELWKVAPNCQQHGQVHAQRRENTAPFLFPFLPALPRHLVHCPTLSFPFSCASLASLDCQHRGLFVTMGKPPLLLQPWTPLFLSTEALHGETFSNLSYPGHMITPCWLLKVKINGPPAYTR